MIICIRVYTFQMNCTVYTSLYIYTYTCSSRSSRLCTHTVQRNRCTLCVSIHDRLSQLPSEGYLTFLDQRLTPGSLRFIEYIWLIPNQSTKLPTYSVLHMLLFIRRHMWSTFLRFFAGMFAGTNLIHSNINDSERICKNRKGSLRHSLNVSRYGTRSSTATFALVF